MVTSGIFEALRTTKNQPNPTDPTDLLTGFLRLGGYNPINRVYKVVVSTGNTATIIMKDVQTVIESVDNLLEKYGVFATQIQYLSIILVQ